LQLPIALDTFLDIAFPCSCQRRLGHVPNSFDNTTAIR
jgi:hypothetical protein